MSRDKPKAGLSSASESKQYKDDNEEYAEDISDEPIGDDYYGDEETAGVTLSSVYADYLREIGNGDLIFNRHFMENVA